MTAWKNRPREVAYALNPAFCGETIRTCVAEHAGVDGRAMPYPLCHLVLPIVLHKETRDLLPPTSRKRMHTWLAENQGAKIGFDQRTRSMIPFTREALAFLLHQGAVKVNRDGDIDAGRPRKAGRRPQLSGDAAECAKGARIVGRWFASAGGPPLIFSMWGVRP